MRHSRQKFLLLWFCILAGLLGLWSTADCGGETTLTPASVESDYSVQPLVDSMRGPLDGLEESLFNDAADGTLDRFSLFESALIAGGVDRPEDLRHYQTLLDRLAEEMQKTGRLNGSARRDAETILRFLHTRVFYGGYSLAATDVRQAFDQGRYNCVSATVLYLCLARQSGLRCCGLEAPGHALCRVFLPEGSMIVETTCPNWFSQSRSISPGTYAGSKSTNAMPPAQVPGLNAPDFVGSYLEISRRPSPPAPLPEGEGSSKPSPPVPLPKGEGRFEVREVSLIQLVAMIYYNRGVDLLREKCYSEAIAVNAKSLTLDPRNPIAQGNFLASINNSAIALGEEGRYAEAADLLRQGLACNPNYAPFVQNIQYIYHRWTKSSYLIQEFDAGRNTY
jgi:tetratricopeptide (TPR) repeat protein